ncbi:hypothetical protein H6P81_009915 [Aristolochia fimbriata]|uniref:Uncharacterized protein n=1 Tax=Aristolochia fimbriata TaxID=158543 RepID=A0AAV7EPA9_ARIFI|nr:hypothetical protein H6P81_009915 [Aristolochia fimbriata]
MPHARESSGIDEMDGRILIRRRAKQIGRSGIRETGRRSATRALRTAQNPTDTLETPPGRCSFLGRGASHSGGSHGNRSGVGVYRGTVTLSLSAFYQH